MTWGMESGRSRGPSQKERLRLSEERYRLIADNTSDVIWTMDLEGRFTYLSPSIERLRGYTPEEVLQQSIEEVMDPQAAVEIRRNFEANLDRYRASRTAQTRLRLEQPCKDGSWVWTEVITNGLYDDEGNLIAILGVTRDITEQVRIEQELRAAKEAAEKALAQVKTLSGLIPICAGCKQIRDDEGYWKRVEDYLSSHTEARFSHGMCPSCLENLYPEFREAWEEPAQASGDQGSQAVPGSGSSLPAT